MKKLFIVLLLTALVPFAVGCNGLFGTDSDDSNSYWPPVSTKLISKSITMTLPSSIKSSIRALTAAQAPTYKPVMTINGQTAIGTWVSGFNYKFTFEFTAAEVTNSSSAKVTLIDDNGKAFSFDVPSISLSNTTVALNITEITATGATVAVDNNAPTTAALASAMAIKDITYNNVSLYNAENSKENPMLLTSLLPEFKVTFSAPVTGDPAGEIVVTKLVQTWVEDTTGTSEDYNRGSYTYVEGTSVTFSLPTEQFKVVDNNEVVTVTVNETGKKLTADTLYRISMKDGAKVNNLPAAPFTVYVKTSGTPAAAPAALTSAKVNDVEVVTITTPATTVPSVYPSTTDTKLVLTFDNAVAAPTEGTVSINDGTNTFSVALNTDNVTMSTDNKIVTVTFPSKSLTAGATYTVTYESGVWVGMPTPTPGPLTFTVLQ